MGKVTKKLLSILLALSMVLTSIAVIPAEAAEKKTKEARSSSYTWVNNDKLLEYPAASTKAEASNTQSGYGAEKMLDGNNNTRWEASWNNPPKEVSIVLSAQKAEYITGIKYVSRLDNNIAGIMTEYEIFASEDGETYSEESVVKGKLVKRLDTFYILFEQPVKAKSIKIKSDACAVSEMRLLYTPSGEADYDALMEEAESLREEVDGSTGMDTGLWTLESLAEFDKGMSIVKNNGKPSEAEKLATVNGQIIELISTLKRAQLASTVELNQDLRVAESLLEAAVVGTKPMTWAQADVDAFQKIVEAAADVAGTQVAGTGIVQDTAKELADGMLAFKTAQIKPKVTYTGTAYQPLDYIFDQLLASHFQGSGAGENVYLEMDYETALEFTSLKFQTWWASGQCIQEVKVSVKDENGEWQWVDGGKTYQMNWTTSSGESETQMVNFDAPVKGTALRCYILKASNTYVIDELTVGTSVAEEDMEIYLDYEVLEMQEGETVKLTATVLPEHATNKKVIWKSSNETVLTVKEDGTLTAVALPDGEESADVQITATTEYGNKTAVCNVIVKQKAADEKDKAKTLIRLANAEKLANAAKAADYKDGAINVFKSTLAEIKELLAQNISVGELSKIDSRIKAAVTKFEEASLIPVQTVTALIERITGKGSSENFILETITADPETGNDVYEVDWDAASGKVVLRGNDGVSLATAYNYYLKYYAYLDFPYVGEADLTLPEQLPQVTEKVRIVFPYEYRHYFNENCEYKYTADLYGEKEWQHRIDWMAMNGFNMFLLDIGDQEIWYNAKEELGLSEDALFELRHANNGTEQYYGKYEVSEAAIRKEGDLARKVVEMAFGFGMEPEIRPFIGQVPFMFPNQHDDYYGANAKSKMTIDLEGSLFDGLFLYSAARWMNLPQGVFISPSVEDADSAKAQEMHDKFMQISDIYYASLMETLGFNKYGRVPQFAFKDLIGEQGFVVSHPAFPRTVLREFNEQLLKVNPDAVWMQSSWRYQTWLTEYYENNLMFVDLSADNRPKWTSNNEFGGNPWLWSMLFNFGGNTGMGGGFDSLSEDVIDAKDRAQHMRGVSISPEGGDTNPALYAFMAEMTWRSEKVDVEQWIKDYVKRRYGAANYKGAQKELDAAWDTLYHTVYSDFVSGDGPSQTVVNASPRLSGAIARVYGSNAKVYQTSKLFPAWENMLKAAEKMEQLTPQFKYDLVDITRQILGDLSGEVYNKIQLEFASGNKEKAMECANQMVKICRDMDEILSTETEFLLGTRLERAKNRGVTETDKMFFEKVERTFDTYWILDKPGDGGLTDYCNKHLSGLMTDYYMMRWETFAKYLEEALDANMTVDEFNSIQQPKVDAEILKNVVAWSEDNASYPSEGTGSAVEISQRLWEEYQDIMKEIDEAEFVDDTKDIPLDGVIATAGDEEKSGSFGSDGAASLAIDGKENTAWFTSWNGWGTTVSGRNAWIDLQFPEPQVVDGLRYLPSQNDYGYEANAITRYEVWVKTAGADDYQKVTEGFWASTSNWKNASFDAVENVTNVRLLGTQTGTNNWWAHAAEVRATAPKQEEADKTWLTELIEYADSQKAHEDYKYVVPVVKAAFEKALAEAVAVNEDANATQEEVDAAYDALLQMVHYLTFTGNSESLKVLVDAAKGLNEKLYTTDSWAVLKDALEKAEAVLADENALQAEIDVARNVLQAAMDALVKNPVDKTKLQKLVNKSKKYEDAIDQYTPATAEIFEGALAYARGILAKDDATQEEVDAAYAGLQNAIFGLRLIPDKGKLEDLIEKASRVDTTNFTAESAEVFVAALNHAKAVFADANATEDDVKAVEKALKKAQKNLVAKADADKKGNDKKADDKVASGNGNSKSAAKTGDASQTMVIMMAMLMAGAVAVMSFRRKMNK